MANNTVLEIFGNTVKVEVVNARRLYYSLYHVGSNIINQGGYFAIYSRRSALSSLDDSYPYPHFTYFVYVKNKEEGNPVKLVEEILEAHTKYQRPDGWTKEEKISRMEIHQDRLDGFGYGLWHRFIQWLKGTPIGKYVGGKPVRYDIRVVTYRRIKDEQEVVVVSIVGHGGRNSIDAWEAINPAIRWTGDYGRLRVDSKL